VAQEVEETSERSSSGWVALPGLDYSPERGLAVAASLLYYFRTGAPDERPSRIGTQTSISWDKRGEVALTPDLWLFDERLNLGGSAQLSYFDYGYFGIGNDTSTADREDFTAMRASVRGEAVVRVFGDFFAGGLYDYRYEHIAEIDDGGELDMDAVEGAGGGILSGIGAIVRYDSRDNTFQPRSGGIVTISPRLYHQDLGSEFDFARYLLDASWFFGIQGPHVIALDGRVDLRRGDPPFDHMSLAGGGRLLRGMLEGRYRDDLFIGGQAEYRFPLWWRFGGVTFAGLGRVAGAFEELDLTGLKHSVGAGLRFAVKPDERINLRFDAATADGAFNLYFGIGEAF
jgi:outer membrane protein assembly factor BamA